MTITGPEQDGPPDGAGDGGLRAILDGMPVAVTCASLESGRILYVNAKFRALFGYDLADFETVEDWVNSAYPVTAERDRVTEKWIGSFGRRDQEPQEIAPVEIDIYCKDGGTRTVIQGGALLPQAGMAVATFVDISERKRDEQKIRHLAEVDPLTGLLNRRAFEVQLESGVAEAGHRRHCMHLLVLDLDHFKAVNDRFGHPDGDRLLKTVAGRISACVRFSDPVARFGGDEFGVILSGPASREQVGRICDKIVAAMVPPVELAGGEVRIGISIGVSRFPDDARDRSALFEAADRALYRVKREGRGHWRFAAVAEG